MELLGWENCIEQGGVATLDCIPIIFWRVVNILLMFAGLAALITLFISGIRFMNAAGDPKQLESGRNGILNAVIGLIVIIMSFLIINIISIVTGVSCIRGFGFSCEKQTTTNNSPNP